MNSPRVSVILSVFNGEAYLAQAVSSVLRQTFADFEFLVVDDGSTDRTPEILASLADPRLNVITQPNAGLTVSLNRAIALSRGQLIARMDADDEALPDRLARQVAFLDVHPEVGVLGTGCREIGPRGELLGEFVPPADDAVIRRALPRRNPFVHSSVIVRRQVGAAVGWYDERLVVAQDYDLWIRLRRRTRLANLPEPLMRRRYTAEMISLAHEGERLRAEVRIKLRALMRGDLPPAAALFLMKPLAALLLPAPARKFLRRRFRRDSIRSVNALRDRHPVPTPILHLLVSMSVGGGPTHVFDVATRLPRDEFAVLVAGPDDGPFFRRFARAGIEIHALPLNRLSPWTLCRLVRIVRSRKVKLLHSHGKGAGLYGRLAGLLTGVPVVHTLHGIHFREYSPLAQRLYLGLERALSRMTRRVINVSREQEAEGLGLALFTAEQSAVVVNGVDALGVASAACRDPVERSTLGIGPEDLVLGTVARFDPIKRLLLLIEAVEALAVRFPRVKLVLIGGGDEQKRLRRIVAERGLEGRVVFTGVVESAPRCFPGWDLYVSASRREGLPLALLEAMACGLPVVATDIPGHREVIVAGVTGLLARPEDPGDLAEKIGVLLDDPAMRRRLGETGRQRVREAFALEATVRGIANVYRTALGISNNT